MRASNKKQVPIGPLSDEYMKKLEEKGRKNLEGLGILSKIIKKAFSHFIIEMYLRIGKKNNSNNSKCKDIFPSSSKLFIIYLYYLQFSTSTPSFIHNNIISPKLMASIFLQLG